MQREIRKTAQDRRNRNSENTVKVGYDKRTEERGGIESESSWKLYK